MIVTKCDRCGAYIDKAPDFMPHIRYGNEYQACVGGNGSRKSLCYECYHEFIEWMDGFLKEEEKDET